MMGNRKSGGFLYVDALFSLTLLVILSGALALGIHSMKERTSRYADKAAQFVESENAYYGEKDILVPQE